MAEFDKKFVFSECFTNENGKTSGSGTVGFFMGLAVILIFLSATVGWWMGKPNVMDIMDKTLQLSLISAGLLGIRKLTSTFGGKTNTMETGKDVENNQQQ